MTIKIKLSERMHPFKPIDRKIKKFAQSLQERWRDSIKQIEQHLESDTSDVNHTLQNVARVAQASLDQQTWGLVADHTTRVFAYGAQLAATGEGALTKPPSMEVVADMVQAGHVTDRQAAQFARAYSYSEIQSKDAETIGWFKSRIIQTLERGEHPSRAARQMAQDLDGDYPGWLRIARTETARTLQAGLFDESRRLGVGVVYVPTSPTACEECKRLIDGRVFLRSDLEGQTNYKRKQPDWQPAIPLHPNCTHFAIPASQWLIERATEASDGAIPAEGVKVEYVPPAKR